jgi:hypothetical protein
VKNSLPNDFGQKSSPWFSLSSSHQYNFSKPTRFQLPF